MNRLVWLLALAMTPVLTHAQALRCKDPVSGRTIYTDQPCPGAQLVVPRRTEEQLREDERNATRAREQALRNEELSRQRAQQRLEADRQLETERQASAPAFDPAACRAARAEAEFRASSVTASEEAIRTARHNAALACGQTPPAEIVVVQPPPVVLWPAPLPRHRVYPDSVPSQRRRSPEPERPAEPTGGAIPVNTKPGPPH